MWDDYLSYDLSDPTFTTPGPIDCLIGADLYTEVVIGAPITIHANGPRLLETVFGYTVIGRFKCDSDSSQSVALLAHEDLAPLMERFWEVEEPDLPNVPSPEDEECERHFLQTHRRMEDGRYMVSLPFKSNNPTIVPSTKPVMNRLYSLETKLSKSESLKQDYSAFMEEYERLGHMSPASGPASYIIPHHPVYKVNGEDRKLRVVFDASFKTPTGNLNDHLHIGPKLQADVTATLLNFRYHRLVFSCDIVKMFRQILVEPNDRKFQQIVWRSDPSQPVQFYELNTITYGLRSSPYLAQRVLRQHATNYQDKFPAAAHVLLNNTYVDDIIGGADSPEDLITLKHQLIVLLEKGGFQLSRWSTNYPLLLEPDEQPLKQVTLCSGDSPTTTILGMRWDPATDSFSYEVAPPPTGLTKRLILSTIARLFDPLGYIAPVIFYAKCIMQRTWQWKLGWDEEVPQEIGSLWSQFIEQLPQLSFLSIPRPFPTTDTNYQLICFSDASERGFCAAIYLRATNGSDVSMTLVKSKTRLAPTKTLTIPRLELSGALLLAQLIKTLSQLQENLHINDIYCFTDSMVALSWIRSMPHCLQTYVSNRVQQITSLTKVEWWHHIRGSENPADVGSRGILPSALRDHCLWWTGPSWCYQPIEQWPISSELVPMELPELRRSHLALVAIIPNQELINYAGRHSSFKRFIRIIAYVKRFISNAHIPKHLKRYRTVGPVSAVEFRCANHHYIKLLQHNYFPEVFTGSSFNDMSLELRRLNVFIDPEGLARVGGRLSKAPLMPDHKNPILLPSRSFYTNLVVDHFHRQGHHIGPTALLAMIRQEYWIPKARNLIRALRHKCVVCTRFSRNSIVPFMGDLPKSRFAAARPFLITGVDFAGPFLCRETSRRNSHHIKAYLCLFLCMSSRALHLEVATSLSVEGFLDAFDRFSSRRGLPSQMVSDCGTNFQGAARYIQEVYDLWQRSEVQASVISHTSHLGVQWTFNPPSSPHFGGGWEISVRSVKDLLYRAFGNHPYTLPELCTIFTKVEGILNSRPILPQSSSPDDLETLTPGHFLIGQPITALPEPDLIEVPSNRLNRWQQIRERIQYFWSRWKMEYLSNLQVRQKWTKKSPNLRVGDLVLLLDLNLPPTRWPLGKIISTHPGDDGIVRVVTVRTPQGTYKRPSVKMIPLVLEDIHS
ncbi:hypothetical protein GE061_002339 [Apolygus lucorum]|uniref:Integrase catalytic domain-containing protein n=1 Tax=Apolygus lucorum TaxID=248454 RepID=A0A8S9X4G2_APOLU|nr:hypothetical protein GE061_002339 [Apolygus lucorum]